MEGKRLLYCLLIVNIIINAFTWLHIEDNNIYWLVTLVTGSLGGGVLFYLYAVLMYPKEIAFKLFLALRFLDVFSHFADLGFIDEYDYVFNGIKIVLNVLTIIFITKYFIGERNEWIS